MEESRWLSSSVGGPVLLKCENLQRTGSFKIRGAYVRMSHLSAEERARGVVAASAGNHAQGVALAAQMLGIKATVFMPEGAPIPKLNATRGYGAEVIFHGAILDEALKRAIAYAEETGAVLIHPFDHPDIVAGQATCGLEILEQAPQAASVVVPTGGGGLIAGIALAMKARVPDMTFYSAEPEDFDDTLRSFASGKREKNPRMSGTICDALMTQTPGAVTWEINKKLVGQGVAASDAEVGHAVSFAFRELKLVVEPGGAIGLAALLAGKLDIKGKVVVAVLSGGNVDAEMFQRLIAG